MAYCVCIGGPGCGRLTQSTKIIAHFSLTKIESLELLQAEANSDTERGLKIREYMETGRPVPKGCILDLVLEKMLETCSGAKGFLMVGFPRDKAQAAMFEKEVSRSKPDLK